MCFSATVSFSAGIVLGITGVVAIKKMESPKQLAFAIIPFLFAFQQFIEGVLWLALMHDEFSYLASFATYVFLFVAQIIWPVWVPFSIMCLENSSGRKKVCFVILAIGIMLSSYLTYCYLTNHVSAEISNHHIKYNVAFPGLFGLTWLTRLFYFIPTVISPFISRVRGMRLVGTTLMLSCLITWLIAANYFISIWCFFAAIISIIVAMILARLPRSLKYSIQTV